MSKKSTVQMNSEWGFFKRWQQHPTHCHLVFICYRKNKRGRDVFEEWGSKEQLEKGNANRLKAGLARQFQERGGPSVRLKLQTGMPKGSFRYRDPHPKVPNRFFVNYRTSTTETERWVSAEKLKRMTRKCDELKLERRKEMAKARPEHRQIIEVIYDYRDRLNKIFGQKSFHVDHTIPITKGGTHSPENLQVAPRKWNSGKGNKNNERWNPNVK